MSLAKPITYGNGPKFPRDTACFQNSVMDILCQFPQMEMAWDHLTERIGNPNNRFLQILIFQAHAVKQSSISTSYSTIYENTTAVILVKHFFFIHPLFSLPSEEAKAKSAVLPDFTIPFPCQTPFDCFG